MATRIGMGAKKETNEEEKLKAKIKKLEEENKKIIKENEQLKQKNATKTNNQ